MSVHNTIISSAAKDDVPSHIIRTMPIKIKLEELSSYKASAPKGNRGMIENLIELYSSKKTPNFKTVETSVMRLSDKTKSKQIQEKTARKYEIITGKYKDALPMTGRMGRSIAEKRLRTAGELASITLILFRRATAGDAPATVSVAGDGEAMKNKTKA